MKNLWKKLAQREVYKNAWIEVEEHDVISPRGKKGIYGKVKFKNKAIGIIALDESKHTWLVGQHRYTLDAYRLGNTDGWRSFGDRSAGDC